MKKLYSIILLSTLIFPISTFAEVTANLEQTISTKQQAVDNIISTDNKREHIRFNINEITTPVTIEQSASIKELINISRGGIAVGHDNKLKEGDVIPLKITYKDVTANTEVKIVHSTDTTAGGEFINLDDETLNQLLYMSIMLEADNGMLVTRFRG